MGAGFMDYIVADPILIPDSQRPFYAERVIYLPHSYQPNDDQRAIAPQQMTRDDCGLPRDAFVLCCFNSTYKIGKREFDIWMRVLRQVEHGVLWLFASNDHAQANLRREAAARGVDPARLVFAAGLPVAQHLARHRHADLFVDTFNCNAHTTASDALWSGLPVVTKAGQQFAARVAASLLHAIGLPELVTTTEDTYEALILAIATDPAKLDAVRRKLSANRLTQPLFDTKRYTRNFEAGLRKAHDLHASGRGPEDIVLAEDGV
jgi:predicted O-linked N-acetylglucosamine transferase (SPINDLY family)